MPQCKQCKAAPDGCCNHHKADAARGCTASQLTMRQNGIIVLTNDDPFKDEENLLLLQVPAVYAGRVRATVAALGSKIHYECAAEKGNQISLLVPTSLEAQLLRDLPLCRALSSTPFVVNGRLPSHPPPPFPCPLPPPPSSLVSSHHPPLHLRRLSRRSSRLPHAREALGP